MHLFLLLIFFNLNLFGNELGRLHINLLLNCNYCFYSVSVKKTIFLVGNLPTFFKLLPFFSSFFFQVMMNIDKLRSKSSVDILSQRFKNFVSSIIGNTNMVQTLLSTSLTESQINWVQDDVGSLRNLVAMRSQDLLDFGLSSETVSKIISFFT